MFTRRHELIMDEKDVLTVIEVINKYQNFLLCGTGIALGNCGWADQPEKWFIFVNTTNKRWMRMVNDFDEIETVRVRD